MGVERNDISVAISDQTTKIFDLYFREEVLTRRALAADAALYDTTITLDDATGIIAGQYFGLYTTPKRYYFGTVLSVAGNVLTLDTPLDFAFLTGSVFVPLNRNMAVDGSVTPRYFRLSGPIEGPQISVDLTRLMLKCTTSGAVDLNKFGDITGGITKGLVLRRVDGDVYNIFNVKTNGDFSQLAYDFQSYSASNPAQGVNGFAVRYTFSGQDKHGAVIRLYPGDALEFVVQDNLSTLLTFRALCAGHEVNPC